MILNFFSGFPSLVKVFLIRFLIIFILFESFLYTQNDRYLKLNEPLTAFVAKNSVQFLQFFHSNHSFEFAPKLSDEIINGEKEVRLVQLIYSNKNPVLLIADGCNGLELYALFIGFIVAIPIGSFLKKTSFIILGTATLFFINVLRCVGLIELQMGLNKYFDFYHHFLFKLIMYSAIFYGWILYVNSTKTKND